MLLLPWFCVVSLRLSVVLVRTKACVFPVFLIKFSFLTLKQCNSWYAFILQGLFGDLNVMQVVVKVPPLPPIKKSESIFCCILAAVWDEQLRAGGIITELFKDKADACLASVCDSLNQFNSVRHQSFFLYIFTSLKCFIWTARLRLSKTAHNPFVFLTVLGFVTRSILFSNHHVWSLVRNWHQNRKSGSKNRQVRSS